MSSPGSDVRQWGKLTLGLSHRLDQPKSCAASNPPGREGAGSRGPYLSSLKQYEPMRR